MRSVMTWIRYVPGASLAVMCLGGCATAVRGVDTPISVASVPEAADVRITALDRAQDPVTCLTPCTVELPRKGTYHVEVSKSGYTPFGYTVRSRVGAGGLVAGGLAPAVSSVAVLPGVIDGRNGSMHDLRPVDVVVTLGAEGEVSTAVDDDADQVLPSQPVERATDFILSTQDAPAADAEASRDP